MALASAHSGDLAKGGVETARAGELNREKAAAMRILNARLLLMEGNADLAEEVFQSFIKSYPQDPAVPDVRKYIEKIGETRKAAAAAAAVSTPEAFEPTAADSEAAGNEKLEEAWAPPDVDAGMPPTAVGVISVYHRPKLPYYFAEDRTTDGTS